MSGPIVVEFADEFTDEALDLLADAILEQLQRERDDVAPTSQEPTA